MRKYNFTIRSKLRHAAHLEDAKLRLALRLRLRLILHLDGLILRREIQTDTIDTMAFVRRGGEALTLEDVAQMTATVRADDFNTRHPQAAVFVASHGPRDAVEVGGPSTAGLELRVGLVEGCVAPRTGVDTFAGVVLVVFP